MKPIEVLDSAMFGPIVRYSDHCAAMERNTARVEALLREIEQLTSTCERLQAEVQMLRGGQRAVNNLVETIPPGRWNGKPKAL